MQYLMRACLFFYHLWQRVFLLLRLPELNKGIVACIVAPVEELMDVPVFDVILPIIVGLKIPRDASIL